MNRKAVREEEGLACGQIGFDVLLVDVGDDGVGSGDENDIGGLDGFGGGEDFESAFFGNGNGFATGVESDDNFNAAVLEVKGVGVALGAKTDDGHGLAF